MQISQASLTTSKISTLQLDKPTEQKPQVSTLLPYTLKWRQEQLWVSKTFELPEQQYLPGLESEQQLIDCLKHSPVRLVCIDQNLGEEKIKRWAYACKQAKKKIFLRVPFNFELTSKRRAFSWWLKRVIEWIIATLLLLVLSPIILGVMLLMRVYSSRPIFCQQWR